MCAGLKLRFYTYNFGVFLTVSVSKQLNVNAPEVGPPPSAVSKLPETIFRWHLSPRHKHWPAGPAHFSDRRTSSGQYIFSFTGPYGQPRYMSGHHISNSAGPNDDKSQHIIYFSRRPSHISAVLLLQREASVARVGHVNQTH